MERKIYSKLRAEDFQSWYLSLSMVAYAKVAPKIMFFLNLYPEKLLNGQSAMTRNWINGQGLFWFLWVENQGAFYSVTRWCLCQQWKWVASAYLAGIYSSHVISRTEHILCDIIFWHPLLAFFIGKERDLCFLQYIWSGTWWKYKIHLPAASNACIPLGMLIRFCSCSSMLGTVLSRRNPCLTTVLVRLMPL